MAPIFSQCRPRGGRPGHRLFRAVHDRSTAIGFDSVRSRRTSAKSSVEDLEGFDAVVHLAALSNDPIGNLNERMDGRDQHGGSVRLAEMAGRPACGDSSFPRRASCTACRDARGSHRGVAAGDPRPSTRGRKSKPETRIASSGARPDSRPTFLRNGTVYGLSPRMRFDTVLNDLVGAAVTTGKVVVYGDGKPWRPVMHVEDVSRAFCGARRRPSKPIHNQAFNLGANHLNHQIIQLGRNRRPKTVPGSKLEVLDQAGRRPAHLSDGFRSSPGRSRISSSTGTPRRGARDLYAAFHRLPLTQDDFIDRKFTRLKWLRHLLE